MNHGEEMSILGLVMGASLLVKIVMLILVLASLISWYLIIMRSSQISKLEKGLLQFIKQLRSSPTVDVFHQSIAKDENIAHPVRQIFEAGYQEFQLLKTAKPIGSVSPYIGLFGTVWGIMNAFIGLSQVQQATLSTVAPGIAEALIATAIGLFAAIPAVIAYNRLSGKAAAISARYYHFANEMQMHLNRTMLKPAKA